MNIAIQMGRLTKDPEIQTTANGTTFARFSLAIDRRFKREGEPEADFFDYSAVGKTAEFVGKYLKKGTKVVVEAEPQNNNYTNKEGQKVYAIRFFVHSIEFAESKSSDPVEQAKNTDFLKVPDGLVEELPFA